MLRLLWLAGIFALSLPSVLRADILTDPSQLNPANSVIDFESFTPGSVADPLVMPGITFSTSGSLYVFNSTPYSPPPVVSGNTLQAYQGGYLDLRMDFDAPVSEIGFGMWDPNLGGNFLNVYSASNTLLEQVQFPTGAPGGSFAAFRGIRRNANEIAYAILDLAASNEFYGIDNVSFGANAVPEPAAAGGALVGLGWMLLRRRRNRCAVQGVS